MNQLVKKYGMYKTHIKKSKIKKSYSYSEILLNFICHSIFNWQAFQNLKLPKNHINEIIWTQNQCTK